MHSEFAKEKLDKVKIIDKIDSSHSHILSAETLSEYDIELARKMVSRGVINRYHVDGATYYVNPANNLLDMGK